MESFSVFATLKGKTYDNNSVTLEPSIQELVIEFRPMLLILSVLLHHAVC